MADLNVRLETLPKMWVASVQATGNAPEDEAWRRLRDYATSKGLLEDSAQHPIYGFNNPPPTPGAKEYGYELWIRVDAPGPAEPPVIFKEFEGGLFAVTDSTLQEIGATWHALWDWAQTSPHHWRKAHELEKVVNPNAPADELAFELYLPVEQ